MIFGEALEKACDAQKDGKTTTLEVMCTRELGGPFRRDALSKPVRLLDKYKDHGTARPVPARERISGRPFQGRPFFLTSRPVMEPIPYFVAALAVFVGGFARGFSGFGSGMIWAGGLSLVLPPVVVVPVIYLLEFAVSAHLVPRVWSEIHWPSLRWLLLAALVATAPGLYLLAILPGDLMRIVIAVVILSATVSLWRGLTLKAMPSPSTAAGTGVLCGVLAGATAMGGPPAILLYFSSPTSVVVSRASVIGCLFGLNVIAGVLAIAPGLYTREVGLWALALVLPMLAGIVLGNRQFGRSDPERFRRFVLLLLAALSLAVLLRALLG